MGDFEEKCRYTILLNQKIELTFIFPTYNDSIGAEAFVLFAIPHLKQKS